MSKPRNPWQSMVPALILVAVIDSGINDEREDPRDNLWLNLAEIRIRILR